VKARLLTGDCLERLRELPDASVAAVVTDPPYGLGFMGKAWDHAVPSAEVWREVLRVLRPGGHMVAFFGSRTYHRGAVAIEDAGFEIRDQIMWIYGSGFPKSLDVSKAIDKAAGAERTPERCRYCGGTGRAYDPHTNEGPCCPECNGRGFMFVERPKFTKGRGHGREDDGSVKYKGVNGGHDGKLDHAITAPATDAARQWSGWGTALKPAHEPIVLARKPLQGTVAANVLAHGTGAINVEGCRVGDTVETWPTTRSYAPGQMQPGGVGKTMQCGAPPPGRWPANVTHDGSDEPCGLLGDAARFFYSPKADAEDRNEGLPRGMRNTHPTVKPVDLMRWLVKLITPPGGLVLDPFMGSGSTGKAALLDGFDFIGVDLDPKHVAIAEARLRNAGGLFVEIEVG
jgi:site-specific DNA-methyltransferase (adenine-specific)